MKHQPKTASKSTGPSSCSPRRPPCALMTASAAMQADCAALKSLADAGYEIVVVRDVDFEASARILEKVRCETLAQFNSVANSVLDRNDPPNTTDHNKKVTKVHE